MFYNTFIKCANQNRNYYLCTRIQYLPIDIMFKG